MAQSRSLISVSLSFVLLQSPVSFAGPGATFNQKPKANAGELERGLSRYEGQVSFITAERVVHARALAAAAAGGGPALESAKSESGGGGRREVVDSDVFNVGPKGSKLLVLLNGYRGLTILDFAKGADQPELIGRAPPTGNHPTNMYVDWKNKKAVVIENWNRQNYGSGARILVYDLKDLSKPKLIQNAEVEGTVSDSRLVGDVLYVVGQKVSQGGYSSRGEERTSFAKSFKITKSSIEVVDERPLLNHIGYRENMGIQEVVRADGSYGYYVTAVTSKKGSYWWAPTQSEIEVLDISSPQGKIEHALVASVRGGVQKRSWVNIRNGALVVASNYQSKEGDWRSPMRVAVEVFKLPHQGMKVITEREAQYRELALERAGSGLEEAEAEQLLSESDIKLRGVFVKKVNPTNKDEYLVKSVPDYKTLDFGDTTGQSAAVQDVRMVVDDKGQARLQVAWVPANMKDPLDIVDVTDVDSRPVYQSRLLFDGWLERTIPLEFEGRHFVLGLGYINPAVDNPENRRVAQAKLIEIRQGARGKWVAEDIDTLNLEKVQWSDVGGQDKLVSVNYDPTTGKGSVLFSGHNWSRRESFSGGQSVDFNLAAKGTDAPLTEGAFIRGEEGWLRRVFTHPGLAAMMTFSDRELGIFKNGETLSSSKVLDAAKRLELARNIKAYYEIPSAKRGVQVLSSDYSSSEEKTEIRIVPMETPDVDGEAKKVANIILPGRLKDVWVDVKTGNIIVLSSEAKYEQSKTEDATNQTVTLRAIQINVAENLTSMSTLWQNVETQKYEYRGRRPFPGNLDSDEELGLRSNLVGLVRVEGGWAFTDEFSQIWVLKPQGRNLVATKVALKLPESLKKASVTLARMDDILVLNVDRPVATELKDSNWKFVESWVMKVDTSGPTEWTVDESQSFNIPGSARGFVYGKTGKIAAVLSEETRVLDLPGNITEPSINLTWIGATGAKLTAILAVDPGFELARTSPNQWVYVEKSTAARPNFYFGVRRPSYYGGYAESTYQLGFLDVDLKTHKMYRTVRALDGQLSGYSASVVQVTEGPSMAEKNVVVSTGSDLQVLGVNTLTYQVAAKVVTPVNTHVEIPSDNQSRGRQKAAVVPKTVWSLPGYVGNDVGAISISGDNIRVALGDYGVCEAVLSEPAPADLGKK